MILVNGYILTFLEHAIKEKRVVLDFTKSDEEFQRYYKMTKKEAEGNINLLERQIKGSRQDIEDGTNQRMLEFIKENRDEMLRGKDNNKKLE